MLIEKPPEIYNKLWKVTACVLSENSPKFVEYIYFEKNGEVFYQIGKEDLVCYKMKENTFVIRFWFKHLFTFLTSGEDIIFSTLQKMSYFYEEVPLEVLLTLPNPRAQTWAKQKINSEI